VLAERALFLPSVGVVIALAAAMEILAETKTESNPRAATYVLMGAALVMTLGIARSSSRNTAWKNNASLIEQNVEDLPTSWQAHMMMAQLHSERGQRREALQETELAVRLGARDDYHLLAFAADMYQMQGNCARASIFYERSLNILPDQPQVRTNAAICASRNASNVR
jgi:tetratricopeptide (TPR) repeat protein